MTSEPSSVLLKRIDMEEIIYGFRERKRGSLLRPIHLATQEYSGFMREITPEKRVVVFSSTLGLLFWRRRPGQFSHPFWRNCCSDLTRLQERQARMLLSEVGGMNLQLKRSRGLSLGLTLSFIFNTDD